MSNKTVHFINLTNGLEALPEIQPGESINYMYLASTTIENKNYLKLFSDLDHNFLFHLAIGSNVVFYDFGTNRVLSKTCYLGVSLIKYVLTRYWLDLDDKGLAIRYSRDGKYKYNEHRFFSYIYDQLFTFDSNKDKVALKVKLKKYKTKFLLTDSIKLSFISSATTHDGDYEYYKNIIRTCLRLNA